jgi:crotonobetainyl-CoA:carnitine CoA-transferase CaiB-like acyl-CoA transferase
MFAGALRFGGRHRNHCPYCLYSLHVDGRVPGDRASDCRSRMAPVGVFARRNGEQAIVHRCLGCNFERHCRVAADDDIAAVMRLAVVEARGAKRAAAPDVMTA